MTFHLHFHDPLDDLPANQTEIAFCTAGLPDAEKIATITIDQPTPKSKPAWNGTRLVGWTHADADAMRERSLRRLVADANACERMREACKLAEQTLTHIIEMNGIDAEGSSPCAQSVRSLRAALAATMPDAELEAKQTSDRVIDPLARDIAGLPVLNPAGEWPIFSLSGKQLTIEYGPDDRLCVFDYAIGQRSDEWAMHSNRITAAEAHAFVKKYHGKAKADELVPLPLAESAPCETDGVPDNRAPVDTDRLMRNYAKKVIGMVRGAMGTPPSIAAHPDGLLSHDDTPAPDGGAA